MNRDLYACPDCEIGRPTRTCPTCHGTGQVWYQVERRINTTQQNTRRHPYGGRPSSHVARIGQPLKEQP